MSLQQLHQTKFAEITPSDGSDGDCSLWWRGCWREPWPAGEELDERLEGVDAPFDGEDLVAPLAQTLADDIGSVVFGFPRKTSFNVARSGGGGPILLPCCSRTR